MVHVKTLTVKLPEPLFADIANEAKARSIPKSHVVRERLSLARTKSLSLWDQIEDLVISDEALPKDLANNKKHLKRYGQNRHHRHRPTGSRP